MKRVGISNFLRFFLYHKDIIKTYISPTDKHLFIPVDLNDLVEREIFPFWTLTLKRIADASKRSSILDEKTKKEIETLFLDGISSKDLFLLIDAVRKSLLLIIENGGFPTLFFLRFDRIKDAATAEFFDNLRGLKDATHQKMSYAFTSYRSLDYLSPVFIKPSLSLFAHDMYIRPAKHEDVKTVCSAYQMQYSQVIPKVLSDELHVLVGGHIQYLQVALIALREQDLSLTTTKDLFAYLVHDEQINLQSEELWESLSIPEQEVLSKVIRNINISMEAKEEAKYLWDMGLLTDGAKRTEIFSPLFSYYVDQKKGKKVHVTSIEFTKKEHALFSFLQQRLNEICDREKIIEAVWPEVTTLGVTDWAIDRLVARARNKLKRQNSAFEIQTVKTRGYKLISIK